MPHPPPIHHIFPSLWNPDGPNWNCIPFNNTPAMQGHFWWRDSCLDPLCSSGPWHPHRTTSKTLCWDPPSSPTKWTWNKQVVIPMVLTLLSPSLTLHYTSTLMSQNKTQGVLALFQTYLQQRRGLESVLPRLPNCVIQYLCPPDIYCNSVAYRPFFICLWDRNATLPL